MPYKTSEAKNAHQRNWYEKNKEMYIERNRLAKAEKRAYIQDLKTKTACADCKRYFHYCQMDFDHLEDKVTEVGKLVGWGWSKLLAEIAKCDIVCANCHRLRTHKRQADLE